MASYAENVSIWWRHHGHDIDHNARGRMLKLCSGYDFTKDTHASPLRTSYGRAFWILWRKKYRVISRVHCILKDGGIIRMTHIMSRPNPTQDFSKARQNMYGTGMNAYKINKSISKNTRARSMLMNNMNRITHLKCTALLYRRHRAQCQSAKNDSVAHHAQVCLG